MGRKPKVALVVDQPDWAFAISAQDMVKNMPWFDFDIIDYYHVNEAIWEKYDLVYLFGHYMAEWVPADFNFDKAVTGIRAEFGCVLNPEDPINSPVDPKHLEMMRKFRAIHGVSQGIVNKYKEHLPEIQYVSHGVDTDFFKPVDKHNQKLTFGWAGNPGNPEKNFDLLKRVFSYRQDVDFKVAEYHNNQLNREGMRDFYNSIDVFILPSRSEGNSASLMEAIASGLPVVATPTGTWLEISKAGGGITIDEISENGLNRAIDQIKSMNLEKLGKINRKEALKWSWDKKAVEFRDFFRGGMMNKTTRTFSHKWETMPEGYGSRTKEQIEFFEKWAIEKYGVKNKKELHDFYKSKTNILEVGPGSCFNAQYIRQYTDAQMTVCDISEVVCEKAKAILKSVAVVNEDLMKITGKYDLIIADGVLHHTENTRLALMHLYDQLVKGGHMYAYIYRQMGPIREFTNEWIRGMMAPMTEDQKIDYVRGLTEIGKQLSKIKDKIHVDHEVFGLKPGDYTPHELMYYGVIKCFWNDIFSEEENNLNNYDWFAPEWAWRHTDEEIREWFQWKTCDLQINNSNPNGISLLVRKK